MSRTALSRLLSVSCLVASLAGAASAGPPPPVVGGEPSPAGRWPDTAAVMDAGITFCTGTLIAPQVVLTAGHCVEGVVGEVKLDAIDADGPGEVIAVTSAIAYPDWETTYDIAVLLLAEPSTIPPRPLATDCVVTESLVSSAPVTLVGYGATTPGGEDLNTALMEGEARILDADCVGGNGCAPAVVPGGEFVAGGAGVDSCFGDSGGPVYLPTPYGTVVAGVVSRGLDDSPTPCGGGGIYVRPDSV
ncbi:MAG TPA: trypsin-like serine protease, partial [Kofleriaceae bacterium]|nr:trypsin-like serine protease [Kofleriaceae bacterium]